MYSKSLHLREDDVIKINYECNVRNTRMYYGKAHVNFHVTLDHRPKQKKKKIPVNMDNIIYHCKQHR